MAAIILFFLPVSDFCFLNACNLFNSLFSRQLIQMHLQTQINAGIFFGRLENIVLKGGNAG